MNGLCEIMKSSTMVQGGHLSHFCPETACLYLSLSSPLLLMMDSKKYMAGGEEFSPTLLFLVFSFLFAHH